MQQTTNKSRRTTSRPGFAARSVVLGVGLLVAAAGGVAGWRAMTGDGGGSSQQTLDTYPVSLTSFEITTTSSGELEAKNQIEVRSELETNSSIVEVIPEGKLVKKGDVLVRLNSDQTQTQITDVSLRVESAKADLEKAETAVVIQEKENASKISQARLKVTLAELGYKQWDEGERVQKQRDHDQAIEKATQEKERLGEKFEKCIELEKKGYLSTDQMKRDKLEYEDSCRALEKAQLAKEIFEKYEIPKDKASKESEVDQAKEELERVVDQTKIELRSKQATEITARRTLEMHEEKLSKLKNQLEKSTILAPSDGLVVYATSMERSRWGGGGDGPLQIGRQVYPNEQLIILPDTSVMLASVRVHETLASRIREGQGATVKVDAVGGRVFRAKVESIGILAEASGWRDPNLREYTVKLALLGTENLELKPSMRCEAEIIMGQVEDALAVPIQAVNNDGQVRFVYVKAEGSGSKYVRRPIKIGRVSESLCEIVAGVKDGERVLLRKPSPGEVLDRQYSDEEIALVGLKRDSTGQIMRVDNPMADGRGKRGTGRPPNGGKDAVVLKDGAAEKSAGEGATPAAEPAAPESGATTTETPRTVGAVAPAGGATTTARKD